MKVIILAAGIGKRFDIDEENKLPKCLLKIKNNETLLSLNLKNTLHLKEIEKTIIVTGFKNNLVVEYVLSKYPHDSNRIEFVFNPDFTKTIIHSVKCGFSNIKEEDKNVLLINGDTLFNKNTFKSAFEICDRNDSSITIFGCTTNDILKDDVKLLTDNNIIKKIGKNIEQYNSVSSGAILFCNEGLDRYLDALESNLINDFKTHHEILEFIRHIGYKIHFHNNVVRDWLEIDTTEDLLSVALSPLLNNLDNL